MTVLIFLTGVSSTKLTKKFTASLDKDKHSSLTLWIIGTTTCSNSVFETLARCTWFMIRSWLPDLPTMSFSSGLIEKHPVQVHSFSGRSTINWNIEGLFTTSRVTNEYKSPRTKLSIFTALMKKLYSLLLKIACTTSWVAVKWWQAREISIVLPTRQVKMASKFLRGNTTTNLWLSITTNRTRVVMLKQ